MLKAWKRAQRRRKYGEPVIVVSGLPRSGTSMMMRMLEAGGIPPLTDGERVADEDNPNGYYELAAVMKTGKDASWLGQAPGKAVKMVTVLLPQLPLDRRHYRVILMVRDLEEVVRSQATMLERKYLKGVKLTNNQLIKMYEQQLRQTRALLKKPEFEWVEIDYAATVSNPASAARTVNELLGLGLDESAMAATVDPKLHRQRVTSDHSGGSGGGNN